MTVLAATPGVAETLVDIFLLLLAAKAGDEVCKRIGQPAIVGEILAGVLVGPPLLGWVEPGETVEALAELGAVFLLFWVGLETRIGELARVGRAAGAVGVLGVALPFAGGALVAWTAGEPAGVVVFTGAALVATSVGITSAVLSELGVVATPAGRTILGAAIVDDILAMLILGAAVGIAGEGGAEYASLVVSSALAVAFVAFFALGGTRVLRARPRLLHAPRFSESPLLPAVLLCLGLAALAGQIGLAAIIGAFLAGMMVAETKEQHPIEAEVAPLYAFFAPFFFVLIGAQLDLDAYLDPGSLGLLAAVTAVAVTTKFAGAWLGARSLGPREAIVVGLGMVPRGEVGIVIAGIALAEGAVSDEFFAVVVGMSVLTTLLAPPLLRASVGRRQS
ncbi:MAG TPA: cation:proton antiporter [Gaiellaceae bacterium]|nr:cation:proton antiporter [Gaiellaceae bacterium]